MEGRCGAVDDGVAVADQDRARRQPGELAHRLRGRGHVLGELRVGPGQASWVGQGVAGDQDAGVRVEDGQVAGCVARGCDDLETEDLIAVAERAQRLWGVDLGKVVRPDVPVAPGASVMT